MIILLNDKEFVDISELSSFKKKLIRRWLQKNHSTFFSLTFVFFVFICTLIGFFSAILFFNTSHISYMKVEKEKIHYQNVYSHNNLFLGDSIMHAYDLEHYFPGIYTVNSGENGDNVDMILEDMEKRVFQYNPSKVFLLIGTNDIRDEHSDEHIVHGIEEIIEKIQERQKYTKIYVLSIYPVNRRNDLYDNIDMVSVGDRTNDRIESLNKQIQFLCNQKKISYIDLYSKMLDDNGDLKIEYTLEGLHLTEKAYEFITEELIFYLEKDEQKILGN